MTRTATVILARSVVNEFVNVAGLWWHTESTFVFYKMQLMVRKLDHEHVDGRG
jgi:hypothetical protein